MDPAIFVRRNTAVGAPPLVPEISAASRDRGDADLAGERGEPRARYRAAAFWAFAWAGGQALARYLLDHPETVAGRTVLDFGSGSGLVALSAAKAGARRVPPPRSITSLPRRLLSMRRSTN